MIDHPLHGGGIGKAHDMADGGRGQIPCLDHRNPGIFQHPPRAGGVLAAGDHNGSTLYQHQKFNAVVCGQGAVEVSLRDGLAAVVMGLAAQESARTGQAIDLTRGDYDLSVLLNFGVA